MILTFIDGIGHIRGGKSRRKFATFDPERGARGTLNIQHNGDLCEVDIEALLALVAAQRDHGGESADKSPAF